METITIDYEDFKDLIEKQSLYTCFINDLNYCISEAELDYDKTDLYLKSDIKELAKKYCSDEYRSRLWVLKKEERKENEDGV